MFFFKNMALWNLPGPQFQRIQAKTETERRREGGLLESQEFQWHQRGLSLNWSNQLNFHSSLHLCPSDTWKFFAWVKLSDWRQCLQHGCGWERKSTMNSGWGSAIQTKHIEIAATAAVYICSSKLATVLHCFKTWRMTKTRMTLLQHFWHFSSSTLSTLRLSIAVATLLVSSTIEFTTHL